MKSIFLACLVSASALMAQTPQPATPATPAPATPPATLPPSLSLKPAQVSPDTVVAEVGDQKLTAADVKKLLKGVPPNLLQNLTRDPKGLLNYMFTLQYLAEEAEKNKLEDQSPTKEQLVFGRSQVLAQASIDHQNSQFQVDEAEQQKYFADNKSEYEQAKIKVIFLSFSPPGGAKDRPTRSEVEAQSKADELVKQLRGGADFGKIAKENSDDTNSSAREGDYGAPVHRSDRITEGVKKAIFDLQPGAVSDPVKQGSGFYIFKMVEKSNESFDEVKPRILAQLKQEHFKKWLDGIQKRYEVKIDNQAFFSSPANVTK